MCRILLEMLIQVTPLSDRQPAIGKTPPNYFARLISPPSQKHPLHKYKYKHNFKSKSNCTCTNSNTDSLLSAQQFSTAYYTTLAKTLTSQVVT